MKNSFTTLLFLFFTFSIFAQGVIYAPKLISPSNNTQNLPAQVTLAWKNVQGGSYYEVQLSMDSTAGKTKVFKAKDSMYVVNNLVFGKTYYWRVKAFNIDSVDSSKWSGFFYFSVLNTVTLVGPSNNSNNNDFPIIISWKGIAGAINYKYEIDISPYFNSPDTIIGNTGNSQTSVNLSYLKGLIQSGVTYYWRVYANDTIARTEWSSVWNFTTSFGLNQPLQLISPADSAVNTQPSFYLNWYEMESASIDYEVQVNNSRDFNGSIIENSPAITATQLKISNLDYGTTYYWRVRGVLPRLHLVQVIDSIVSPWSDVRTFTVAKYPTPIKPMIGDTQIAANVHLRWAPLTATKFECRIDVTDSFNSGVRQDTIINSAKIDSISFKGLHKFTWYYWQVRAYYNDTSSWSPLDSFKTYNHIPPPVLLTPTDSAFNQTLTPTLTWSTVANATAYRFQRANDTGFTIAEFDTVITKNPNTVYKTKKNLNYNTTYYWRVRTLDAKLDSSVWSATYTFTTIDDTIDKLPNQPNLYLPVNGAINQMPNALLVWQQVVGASGYKVIIDTNINFITAPNISSVNNQVIASNLKFGRKYYWKVILLSNKIPKGTSVVDSFTVINQTTLISPLNRVTLTASPNVSVVWNYIDSVKYYECQIDTDSNFMTNNPTFVSLIVHNYKNLATVDTLFSNLNFGMTYYWRVRAMTSNSTSSWSEVRSFTTVNTISIINPVNNSTNIAPQIQLVFTPLAGATQYDYRIDDNSGFATNPIPDSTYGVTSYYINNLLFGKTYYIEVRGRNSSNTSAWSLPVKFSIIDTVIITSPANKAIHQMPLIRLEWDNIEGIQQYIYEVDVYKDFSSQKIIIDTTSNPIVIPTDTLRFGRTYYWKVKALDNSGVKSPYTTVRSFTVIDTMITYAPTIKKNTKTHKQNITFNWEPVTGIKQYELQYDTVSVFVTPHVLSPSITSTQFTVDSLKMGVTYYWRIRANQIKDTTIKTTVGGVTTTTKTTKISDTTRWQKFQGYQVISGVKYLFADNLTFDVYPVPSKNNLYIRYSNPLHVKYIDLTITNILGQELNTERIELNNNSITKEINISNLQSGIYFIRISNNKNQGVRKIVIK